MLHICPVTNSMVAESRQDVLLSFAGHNRVMPDVRFDGAGHILMK